MKGAGFLDEPRNRKHRTSEARARRSAACSAGVEKPGGFRGGADGVCVVERPGTFEIRIALQTIIRQPAESRIEMSPPAPDDEEPSVEVREELDRRAEEVLDGEFVSIEEYLEERED